MRAMIVCYTRTELNAVFKQVSVLRSHFPDDEITVFRPCAKGNEPDRMKQELEEALLSTNPEMVLGFALAGGLTDDLDVGDIVFIEKVCYHSRRQMEKCSGLLSLNPSGDESRLDNIRRNSPSLGAIHISRHGQELVPRRGAQFKIGNAVTVDWFPLPRERRFLGGDHSRRHGNIPMVVEMEDYHMRKVVDACRKMGMPWPRYYSVRVVANPLEWKATRLLAVRSALAASVKADYCLSEEGASSDGLSAVRFEPYLRDKNAWDDVDRRAILISDLQEAAELRFHYDAVKREVAEKAVQVLGILIERIR